MRKGSRVSSVFLIMALILTTAFSTGTQVSTVNAVAKKKSEVLIAYFGRYGNTNFGKDVDATTSASIVKDGKKKRGTTEMLARLIQKETGGDLFCIQTKKKYPAGYNKVIDQNHRELDEDYLPELKKKVKNMKQYDVVFLGYPIWVEDVPQAIKSFINEKKPPADREDKEADSISYRMFHWEFTVEQKEEVKRAMAVRVPKEVILSYFYPETSVVRMMEIRRRYE